MSQDVSTFRRVSVVVLNGEWKALQTVLAMSSRHPEESRGLQSI